MLESLTIFSKGGLVLYQYNSTPSLVKADDGPSFTRAAVSTHVIAKILLDPTVTNKTYHIVDGLTFSWIDDDGEICVIAIYPDILFDGPRLYLRQWAEKLLRSTLKEYKLFQKNLSGYKIRPDPAIFDKTFRVLLDQSKGQQQSIGGPQQTDKTGETKPNNKQPEDKKSKKQGKEKRTWYDGTAKITEKAMAELDMSKDAGDPADAGARALQEARAAYLPTEADLIQEDESKNEEEALGTGMISGLLQQLTGNKTLGDADLDKPLLRMEEMLTSKNVAQEVAHELCEGVRMKIRGKKLNSLYRVQTAVRQALEATLTRMLKTDVDLLRNVMSKRGDLTLFKMTKRSPYVIAVVGINGVGKSTSLAKLAYYFKTSGCSPLLVAGDTFRSGAVEQLKMHADCLDVELFAQGYSKDPSAVAKAAIQYATDNSKDVVLIDTAGRMQNNVPLMKALTKLVQENRPDFVILVCEALVGHDGLSQFTMFKQAIGNRGIDGLVLTKFDTVSDKVGAALTLTHQTGSPIVFCGTGQKYHHLKKLSVPSIITSLFSRDA